MKKSLEPNSIGKIDYIFKGASPRRIEIVTSKTMEKVLMMTRAMTWREAVSEGSESAAIFFFFLELKLFRKHV